MRVPLLQSPFRVRHLPASEGSRNQVWRVQAANLVGTLLSDGSTPLTLFAPTNGAVQTAVQRLKIPLSALLQANGDILSQVRLSIPQATPPPPTPPRRPPAPLLSFSGTFGLVTLTLPHRLAWERTNTCLSDVGCTIEISLGSILVFRSKGFTECTRRARKFLVFSMGQLPGL